MKTPLKLTAVVLGILCAAITAFVWIVAPARDRGLAESDARFRAGFQAEHDAIDAQFNHQERTVNGVRWHYVDEGAPDGEVILFLHGLPEGWYSWRYVLPLVDHRYRLIAIDMQGYGRSDRQDRNLEWHHVAAQTADLLSSLGVTQYYVVAHDWGALIGSVMVSDHPERIKGFVRMEADLVPKDEQNLLATYIQKPQWLLFQSAAAGAFLMRDAGWFIDTVYRSRMTTPFRPADRNYLVYEFSREGVADTLPLYFQRANWDLDGALGRICANRFPFPVLQLQADSDPAQPQALFADAAARCPNVKLEWISNAGHFDNFDQPDQIAAAVNQFVRTATRP